MRKICAVHPGKRELQKMMSGIFGVQDYNIITEDEMLLPFEMARTLSKFRLGQKRRLSTKTFKRHPSIYPHNQPSRVWLGLSLAADQIFCPWDTWAVCQPSPARCFSQGGFLFITYDSAVWNLGSRRRMT